MTEIATNKASDFLGTAVSPVMRIPLELQRRTEIMINWSPSGQEAPHRAGPHSFVEEPIWLPSWDLRSLQSPRPNPFSCSLLRAFVRRPVRSLSELHCPLFSNYDFCLYIRTRTHSGWWRCFLFVFSLLLRTTVESFPEVPVFGTSLVAFSSCFGLSHTFKIQTLVVHKQDSGWSSWTRRESLNTLHKRQ